MVVLGSIARIEPSARRSMAWVCGSQESWSPTASGVSVVARKDLVFLWMERPPLPEMLMQAPI